MRTLVLAASMALAMAGLANGDEMTNTSLEELRRMVPVAGAPVGVMWQAELLGGPADSDFPPGPSDSMLWAVLDYGSDAAMHAALGEGPVADASITAPTWFPQNLAPGTTLKVKRHYRVQGFLDATVMTVANAPGIVILQKALF